MLGPMTSPFDLARHFVGAELLTWLRQKGGAGLHSTGVFHMAWPCASAKLCQQKAASLVIQAMTVTRRS